MAEQIIDGVYGRTVHSDTYGFGSVNVGPSWPAEDKSRYEVIEWSAPETSTRYGVPVEELLEWVVKYNFPKAMTRLVQRWTWRGKVIRLEPVWLAAQCQQWEREILAELVPHIPQR